MAITCNHFSWTSYISFVVKGFLDTKCARYFARVSTSSSTHDQTFRAGIRLLYFLSTMAATQEELYCSNIIRSTLFHPSSLACTQSMEVVMRKDASQCGNNKKSLWQVLVLVIVWLMTQGLASKTKLNGVWLARRNFEKPAIFTVSAVLSSSACAPSAGPFSFKDAGTHTMEDTK